MPTHIDRPIPEQRAEWITLLERLPAEPWIYDGLTTHVYDATGMWVAADLSDDVGAFIVAAPNAMRGLLLENEALREKVYQQEYLLELAHGHAKELMAEVARLEKRPPTQEEWADTVRAARVLGLEVSADGSRISARKHE